MARNQFSSISVYRDGINLVQEILAILLSVHETDDAEYHIAFLNEAIERHLREAASMRHRGDLIREEATLQEKQKDDLMAEAVRYLEEARGHETSAEKIRHQLTRMERYWEMLEADHSWREAAIAWMHQLPKGNAAIKEFLIGLSEEYFRAFFLQVEIVSSKRCRFHWFDDVWTEVSL